MSLKKIKKTDSGKKDDLDPTQDEFIDKTSSALDWAYERRRPLGVLIILALAAAVAGIVFNRVTQDRRAEESLLVSAGLEAAFAEVKPPTEEKTPDETEAAETDKPLTFENAKSRAEEALSRWTKLVEQGEPRFKNLGILEKAAVLLDLEEYEKAVAAYESFMAQAAGAPPWLKAQAQEGLGYALEGAGRSDDALARFEKWMAESEGPTKIVASYHAGRLAQKKGDAEKAEKLFNEVMTAYKNAEAPSRYDILFVQARTRLLTLNPSAEVPDMPAGDMGAFEGLDPAILRQLMQAQRGAGAS